MFPSIIGITSTPNTFPMKAPFMVRRMVTLKLLQVIGLNSIPANWKYTTYSTLSTSSKHLELSLLPPIEST